MSVSPQPMLQHHPTRQRMTVANCAAAATALTTKETILSSQVPPETEKRGWPQQQNRQRKPLRRVPGIRGLAIQYVSN